jgi:hypothetical protein
VSVPSSRAFTTSAVNIPASSSASLRPHVLSRVLRYRSVTNMRMPLCNTVHTNKQMCIYFDWHTSRQRRSFCLGGEGLGSPKAENSYPLGHESLNILQAKGHTRYCRLVLQAARCQITISGIPNCVYYCVIFTAYKQFTNVAAGRGLETDVLGCDSVSLGEWFQTFRMCCGRAQCTAAAHSRSTA